MKDESIHKIAQQFLKTGMSQFRVDVESTIL